MKARGRRWGIPVIQRNIVGRDVTADDHLDAQQELNAFRGIIERWPSLRGNQLRD